VAIGPRSGCQRQADDVPFQPWTELDVEPLLPVLIGELSCDQGVAPVSCCQIEHLAQTGEVATCRQNDGSLDSFARQDVAVVSPRCGRSASSRSTPVAAAGSGKSRRIRRSSRAVVAVMA
jgi:hypothetical protein